jgi:hypothetical protein
MSNHVEIVLNNGAIFSPNDETNLRKFINPSNSEDVKKFDSYIVEADKKPKLIIPLLEDISVEANSSFQGLDTIFPLAGRIDRILKAVSSISGQGSSGSLSNIFNYEMWQKTEPISLNFKTILYTKTNPFLDVWLPVAMLTSQSILSAIRDTKNKKTIYKLPGISLGGVRKFQAQMAREASIGDPSTTSINPKTKKKYTETELDKLAKEEEKKDKQAEEDYKASKSFEKLCTVRIPGIMIISPCMVVSAKPTFSKQYSRINGKPFPIWAEIELQIKSVSPASSSYFTDEILDNFPIISF